MQHPLGVLIQRIMAALEQLICDLHQQTFCILRLHICRHCPQHDRVPAKICNFQSCIFQQRNVVQQRLLFLRRQIDGSRLQQQLTGHIAVAGRQLLVELAFMGSMLIDQAQLVSALCKDVGLKHLSHIVQRLRLTGCRVKVQLLRLCCFRWQFFCRTVFTIHNIAYQGKYGTDILEDTCGIGRRDQHIVEYDGCANFMKGAFETADKITTVSPTYAQEILDPWFSYGLDALLREKQYKLCGILNGIDMEANNPATDPKIPFNYDVTNFEEGKAKCKEALQNKFGLHKDGSPVFAMVSRMVGMKGFDLVQSVADGLVDRGIELVILGSGENQYETFFSDLCARHPGRVGTYIGFEPALSQEIYAGADVFIMPSKSEPCGLAQMVACRYGTPPIVRETGGLRDSIHDCTLGEGNGFTFAGYSAHELYDACCRAQDRYYNKEDWHNLVKHDMECDFSWDLSAKSYEGLYNETANLW